MATSFRLKSLAVILALFSATGMAYAKHADFKGEMCPALDTLDTGFYVGAQVGYDAYKLHRFQNLPLGPSTLTAGNSASATGWVGGLMLGYGMMMNNWFYLGAELNGDLSGATGTTSANIAGTGAVNDTINTQVNGSWGVGLLPGYRFASNYMGYLRLGWNWANIRERVQVIVPGALNSVASKTNTSNGFVLGVGMEGKLVGAWSLRGEYNHTWYSSFTVSNPTIGSCNVSPSDNQYMLGLLYHFA